MPIGLALFSDDESARPLPALLYIRGEERAGERKKGET